MTAPAQFAPAGHAPCARARTATLVLLGWLAACTGAGEATPLLLEARTHKPFDDVVFELEFAITEHNYRITGRNDIGEGLRARGHEFPDMQIIHFCSLEQARALLSLDPGLLAEMPCRIAVRAEGDETVITAILLREDHADERVVALARATNAMLREIVAFAAEGPR